MVTPTGKTITIYPKTGDWLLLKEIEETTGFVNVSAIYRKALINYAESIKKNPDKRDKLIALAKSAEDDMEDMEDKKFGKEFTRMTFYYDDEIKEKKKAIYKRKDLTENEKEVKIRMIDALAERVKSRFKKKEEKMRQKLIGRKRNKTPEEWDEVKKDIKLWKIALKEAEEEVKARGGDKE